MPLPPVMRRARGHCAFFAHARKPSPYRGGDACDEHVEEAARDALERRRAQVRAGGVSRPRACGDSAEARPLALRRLRARRQDEGVRRDLRRQVHTGDRRNGRPEDGRQDTLGRLRWVRSLLELQLYDAETTQAARLAKEYRETVEAIERMESAEGGGADDGLDALAGAIARKLG